MVVNLLRKWVDAIISPKKTFLKESRNTHTLGQGAFHILVSAIISAAITMIIGLFGITNSSLSPFTGMSLGVLLWIVLPILFIVILLLVWVLMSGILYIIAVYIFKGKGSFPQQSYLIALYSAPLGIVTTILSGTGIIGFVLTIIIWIYELYLLTIALKTVHKYSTADAILTWLIPLILLLLFVLMVMGIVFLALLAAKVA